MGRPCLMPLGACASRIADASRIAAMCGLRVTNGYSDLILELFGPEVGAHARSSIGMVIPLNAPVNCEAEVEIVD